jgi:hypothetical protein
MVIIGPGTGCQGQWLSGVLPTSPGLMTFVHPAITGSLQKLTSPRSSS